MDGIHDLGGRPGFGRVARGGDAERSFTADWQRRVFGLCGAVVPGLANVDAFRHAVERVDPETYMAGYWKRWLAALELLAREADPSVRTTGTPSAGRTPSSPPAFAIGDRVRVRSQSVPGHTRLPAYVRGRRGVVTILQGTWVLPDTNAHGRGEHPEPVYAVGFEARELFGESAEPASRVHVDLFESYLEREPQP